MSVCGLVDCPFGVDSIRLGLFGGIAEGESRGRS